MKQERGKVIEKSEIGNASMLIDQRGVRGPESNSGLLQTTGRLESPDSIPFSTPNLIAGLTELG